MSSVEKQSFLELKRLCFEEIQYTRNGDKDSSNSEYEMNFNRVIGVYEDGKRFKVTLTANVWSKGCLLYTSPSPRD